MLWLDQARCNARTAEAIAQQPRRPMLEDDIGCHVALLCAQSIEKCIKGCMLLIGMEAPMSHDVEARIDAFLQQAATRGRRKGPEQQLAELFRARGVRRWARTLLSWTPGAATADQPNYEYPWPDRAEVEIPCGHALFADADERDEWITHARTLSDGAKKIAEAMALQV
jgi:hypothetical protein